MAYWWDCRIESGICCRWVLPGIKYFGSDGADIAYGFEFDEDEILIIEIPFDSVRKSDAKKYSESFFDFLIGKDRNE